jgi:hypothetical protein
MTLEGSVNVSVFWDVHDTVRIAAYNCTKTTAGEIITDFTWDYFFDREWDIAGYERSIDTAVDKIINSYDTLRGYSKLRSYS